MRRCRFLNENRFGAEELLKIYPELTDSERRILVQGCDFSHFACFDTFWEYLEQYKDEYETVICNVLDKSNYKSSKEFDLPCCVFWKYEEVSEIRVLPKGLNSLSDREISKILDKYDFDEIRVKSKFKKEIQKIADKYEDRIEELLDL